MNPDNGTFIHSKFAAHWASYRNSRENAKNANSSNNNNHVSSSNSSCVKEEDAMDVS
jgi:hypothetical protein